jgi:transposase
MERFIGMDVHASSTTIGVVGPTGKRCKSQVVATSAPALIEALKEIRGQLHLCLEECPQSGWLAEVLSPHVAELVVVGVGEQRSRGHKSDAHDAFGLADKLRLHDYKTPVFKQTGSYGRLRQLVRAHRQVVTDVTRMQGRIKALLRSRGVVATGTAVYSIEGREPLVAQLPSQARAAIEVLYAAYDALVPVRRQAELEVVAELNRHAIAKVLQTCPGFGPIRVAEVLSTVVTPTRFRTRQQLWSYCGLGIVMRSSSDWVQLPDGSWKRAEVCRTRGLTRQFNRGLKAVFKGAATTVLTQHKTDEPLRASYQRQVDAGTKPNLAKLTLARKLAATLLAMWKQQQAYDPQRGASA